MLLENAAPLVQRRASITQRSPLLENDSSEGDLLFTSQEYGGPSRQGDYHVMAHLRATRRVCDRWPRPAAETACTAARVESAETAVCSLHTGMHTLI